MVVEAKSEASKPLAREVGSCDWVEAARVGCRKRTRLAPVADMLLNLEESENVCK